MSTVLRKSIAINHNAICEPRQCTIQLKYILLKQIHDEGDGSKGFMIRSFNSNIQGLPQILYENIKVVAKKPGNIPGETRLKHDRNEQAV